jgi:nitrate/TMAO reductase-like tetraheme cytochrome c subunit
VLGLLSFWIKFRIDNGSSSGERFEAHANTRTSSAPWRKREVQRSRRNFVLRYARDRLLEHAVTDTMMRSACRATRRTNLNTPGAVLLWVLLFGVVSPGLSAQEYSEQGAVACVDCHDTPQVMGIVDTAHADFKNPRAPAAQRQCQSCHGPSANHMKFPMQVANVHFGSRAATKPKAQNQMCIACHGTMEQKVAWETSAHGFEEVVCSTCHSMHDPSKIVPAEATVSKGCMECHADLMEGITGSVYTHAVGRSIGGQGEMTCAGCHNPHGPLESSRCLDCHSQAPEVLAQQSEKARRYHEVAVARGTDCMRCHKGIAHPITPLEKAVPLAGN